MVEVVSYTLDEAENNNYYDDLRMSPYFKYMQLTFFIVAFMGVAWKLAASCWSKPDSKKMF